MLSCAAEEHITIFRWNKLLKVTWFQIVPVLSTDLPIIPVMVLH